MRALLCEQVSDSRIRPTGCLFVYYFFEWVLLNQVDFFERGGQCGLRRAAAVGAHIIKIGVVINGDAVFQQSATCAIGLAEAVVHAVVGGSAHLHIGQAFGAVECAFQVGEIGFGVAFGRAQIGGIKGDAAIGVALKQGKLALGDALGALAGLFDDVFKVAAGDGDADFIVAAFEGLHGVGGRGGSGCAGGGAFGGNGGFGFLAAGAQADNQGGEQGG